MTIPIEIKCLEKHICSLDEEHLDKMAEIKIYTTYHRVADFEFSNDMIILTLCDKNVDALSWRNLLEGIQDYCCIM